MNSFLRSFTFKFSILLFLLPINSTALADKNVESCDLFEQNLLDSMTEAQEHPLYIQNNSHGIYVDEFYSYKNLLYISSINLRHSMSNAYPDPDEDFLYHRYIRDTENKKIIVGDYIYTINGQNISLDKIEAAQNQIITYWDERMYDPLISLEQIIEYNGIENLTEDDLDGEFVIGYIDYNIVEEHFSLKPDDQIYIPNENDIQYITIYPEKISGVKEIYVDLNIKEIRELDENKQQYKASYEFTSRWYDYGIILEQAEKSFEDSYWCSWSMKDPSFSGIEAIWNPTFDWINRLNFDKTKNNEEIKFVYTPAYEYENAFEPAYVEINFIQTGQSSFPANFDYRSFPFDKQELDIYLYNYDDVGWRGGAQNVWISQVDSLRGSILEGSEIDLMSHINKLNDYRSLPGWKMSEPSYGIRIQVSRDYSIFRSLFDEGEEGSFTSDEFSQLIQYNVSLEREWLYYIFKILTPILLILIVCWSVFWTSPKELESRLTVTIVCFLALVAYNFVITEDLPQLSYMTLMDYIIITSYIYAAMPTIISILSHRLLERSSISSVNLDRYAKIFGAPSYILILYIITHIQVTENNSIQALKFLTFN